MVTSVQAFAAAEAHLQRQARGITAMVAATLHAQFPTAAFLVLDLFEEQDPDLCEEEAADEALYLDSIRALDGTLVYAFPFPDDDAQLRAATLPVLPNAVLRRAWGELDPQEPAHLLNLIHRINTTDVLYAASRPLLPDLPAQAAHPHDPQEQNLLCLPLTPAAALAAASGS
ncbi:hypothetical protein [Streptomyces sp. NPDC059003]|uniref:hypothetical protein n=1 Tax=Streptomyces sp. NPDC059003 TaxID=3346691 RepID=UPI0036BE013D